MRIEIVYPELWNGGGERLILLLGAALADNGHKVRITTTFIDDYWINDPINEKIEIRLIKTALPHGDFHGRSLAIALNELLSRPIISWFSRGKSKNCECPYDIIIASPAPSPFPIYRFLYGKAVKLVLYCHFPVQLMVKEFGNAQNGNVLCSVYSAYLGWLENFCSNFSDRILYNSLFTKEVVQTCMPSVPMHCLSLAYPPGEYTAIYGSHVKQNQRLRSTSSLITKLREIREEKKIIFTVNRFTPEKNLTLLIEAAGRYNSYRQRDPTIPPIVIVMAGSVTGLLESGRYLQMLQNMVKCMLANDTIIFSLSPDEMTKNALFEMCDVVVFTPRKEHFGIVPVEALLNNKYCIGCDSAGPRETIIDNVTGYKLKHFDAETLTHSLITILQKSHNGAFAQTDAWKSHSKKFRYESFRNCIINSVNYTKH